MPHNKRCRSGFWLAALSALLAGCSVSGPAFKPAPLPPGQGAVYLYRPSATLAAGDPTVLANRVPLARIEPGGYFPYLGQPGPVYFQIGPDTANVAYVRLEAGKEKYLRASDPTGRLKLAPVAPEIGRREIAQCTLLERLQIGGAKAPVSTAAVPSASAPVPAASRAAGAVPRNAGNGSAARTRRPAGPAVKRDTPAGSLPPLQVQGPYSYEAERIAMQQGCTTRDGVRPAAYLVQRSDSLQVYDIACLERRVRVSCRFEYCQPVGP
jgi:hypothetical protein